MARLAQVVEFVYVGLFALLGFLAIRQWRAERSRAALWAALGFAALAAVVVASELLPDDPETSAEIVAGRLLVGVLVLFPYLLYRFTTAFEPPTRRLEGWLGLMTAVLLVATFVLPDFPAEGEPRPGWFMVYLAGFLVHWTVLSVVSAVRLWRAGRGQPSVARARMRMLAYAATVLTIALFLAAAAPEDESALDLAVGFAVMLSAIAFVLGINPPAVVRAIWRRPEQQRFQAAISHLMRATSEDEVVREVLGPMARLVGARAIALVATNGRVIGSHGASDEMVASLARDTDAVLALEAPFGSLVVWSSPYAPYFGREELALLETLAALTGLALDRSRLFSQERAARLALERADELKTNFVALAAHELRTPTTTVHGIIKTLFTHGERLPAEQRAELEVALVRQSERMVSLVEQLLDLSRLDAEAVSIDPRPLVVRERAEEVVATAAGARADDVEIDIPPDLEAVADPHVFERVLSNLVVNALRHGRPPVRVTATQHDHHLRLAVEDRGTGVSPEFVPSLFERFSRSERSRERAGGVGTGLGLAIARSYARAHGGDLLYEPARPHGARFECVLPTAAASSG